MNRLLNRLLDKVNKPAAVLIALVLLISVNGFIYFYYYRDSDRGPIVEEERIFPRVEGISAGTLKKDAAPKVGRGAVGGDQDEAPPVQAASPHSPQPAPASSKASDEVGLPVGTSAVSPTVPAAPQGTAPPSTATPTATASSTAAATATPTATASSTAAATAPPATAPPATATDAPTLRNSIEEGQALPGASQIDSPQLPATPTPQDVRPRP
jgi:hypothetical protein